MPRTLLAALLLVVLVPAPGAAQGVRSFSLSLDNDGLTFWDPPSQRADWYYTHGLRMEATLARTPPWTDREVCDGAEVPEAGCVLTNVSLGQQIYTPENVFSSDPPVDDHPYGGFLYGEVGGEIIDPDGRTEFALRVGVTGPPSLGRQAHQGVHRWLDKAEPVGWEHQIPFEVAFALSVHRTAPWSPLPAEAGFSAALVPRWGATLGTLRTSADAGLGLWVGWNAPAGIGGRGPASGGGFHALAEIGTGGELVLRDLFLDGSTFGESVATERNAWVSSRSGRVQVGVAGFALEFAASRVSPRFRAQQEAHAYGTLRFIVHP